MSDPMRFDYCVVGAGSAGYAAANTARNLGKTVAIVDAPGPLGGLCILRGCMPSKTLLRSSEVVHLVRTAPEVGIETQGVHVDFPHIAARKRRIIKDFADDRAAGIEKFPLFRGNARFVARDAIGVDGQTIAAERFLIATGSVVNVPNVPGLHESGFVTTDDVLDYETLPRSVIVLGGGASACELGQYLGRLGVETTIVQRSKTLLSGEDEDVALSLAENLERDGIRIITGATITAVDAGVAGKNVHYSRDGKPHSVAAAEIFAALGRRANVDGLSLDTAGVEFDRHGVKVNAYLQTSNPIVYAAGDVIHESSQLVHVAVRDGELAAANAFASSPTKVDERLEQARAIFTDPQVAVAGLTEKECRARGIDYARASYPFDDLGKAIAV
ncbi:MAG TPA: FAD-dependent oxidoreductase, partial [Candidatus Eremiobacteraceae bacterium]|nr:FAD-dependent oxidoreductase [Candidatus Eremiobacteraceae bacterium]